MRFPKLRRNQRWIVALAVVALLAVTAATLLLRSDTLSGKTEEQPRTVNVDQIARLAREGDIRSLSLNGDVVTAQLADSSIVVSRKESQVSILDILRSYGVPDSSLQQISLEVKDPLAASSQGGTWVFMLVSGISVILVLGVVFPLIEPDGGLQNKEDVVACALNLADRGRDALGIG